VQWETADLERVLARRLKKRPVILDGLLVLDVLQQVGRKPDFLVFVVSDEGMRTFGHQVEAYRLRHRPFEIADFIIKWFSEQD
jgi:hypothetical protein